MFVKKFPYWAILNMKRGDTRKKEMWDNKRGEKMDVQQEIIFRQIGAKVAYYRTLRGITQEKLAEKMGHVYVFKNNRPKAKRPPGCPDGLSLV